MIQASKQEIEAFLKSTHFTGYQSVPLPYDLRVPGSDKREAVDFYLGDRVQGKSVLDVGTYYGLYPCEAISRGAIRAVGIEQDPERYSVAKRISEFHGIRYEIRNANVEQLDGMERFDLVLFLNVLHHVLDPIEAISRLTRLCSDTLLVEFCLPWDYSYLKFIKGEDGRVHGRGWAMARSILMRLACGGLPIMAIGDREYHRTFYFSPEAFRNLFVLHHKFFESVSFAPSPSSRFRCVAICKVRRQTA
jgi:SAM-dependent methyltransferase